MKTQTILIVSGVAVILYFVYRWTGAASNCSFFDAIMGKCGAS